MTRFVKESSMKNLLAQTALGVCLALGVGVAQASNLTLQASVVQEVPPDEVRLSFYIEQEGLQVGTLNQKVLEQLDSARSQIPSGVVWQTRALNSHPVYDEKGRTNRWVVRADFEVRGALGPAMDQSLQVLSQRASFSGLTYAISAKRQQELETHMLQELGNRIQSRGLTMARALGYNATELVEARLLQSGQPPMLRPVPLMTMAAVKSAPELSQQAGLLTVEWSMEATLKLSK